MELLYEQESQADEFIVDWMRRTIADALSQYKPMRGNAIWQWRALTVTCEP